MRPVFIAAAFLVVVVLILGAFVQLQSILLSAVCLLAITGGALIAPLRTRRFDIMVHPAPVGPEVSSSPAVVIEGRRHPLAFPVRLRFRVALRNPLPLAAIAAVCAASLYVGTVDVGAFRFIDIERDPRGVALWGLGYICYLFVFPTFRWFEERILIRSGVPILGEILSRHPARFGGTEISYQIRFGRDRAGGMGRNFGSVQVQDNAVPVLFARYNPDFSIPGCGFWFHKIELESDQSAA